MKKILGLFFIALTQFEGVAQLITTVAGNGINGYTGDGGPAISASFGYCPGFAVSSPGVIYIASATDYVIRKVTTGGTISTFAGNGTPGYNGNGGPATSAQLYNPYAVAVDAVGNVYIADKDNSVIRKVNTSGVISTYAGNGTYGYSGDGGQAINAMISQPWGIAVDAGGALYIADEGNYVVRKVSTAGIITTIAGCGIGGYSGDGGPATSAKFGGPRYVHTDQSGNLYIVDVFDNAVRMVNTSGIITTFAGNHTGGYSGDGGLAVNAQLNNPGGITTDSQGNLYIADFANAVVRKVDGAGVITTVVGTGTGGYSGDGGAPMQAQLYGPIGVAFDASSNLYIDDGNNFRIRKVTGLVGIDLYTANAKAFVYPNPANSILEIQTSSKIDELKIADILGNDANTEIKNSAIDVSNLQNGIYFLTITSGNQTHTQKFIVQH